MQIRNFVYLKISVAVHDDFVVVLKYIFHVLYKCNKPPDEFGLVSSCRSWQMLLKAETDDI